MVNGVPVLIPIGRFRGSGTSEAGSIPRAWKMVAPMSSGLGGSQVG